MATKVKKVDNTIPKGERYQKFTGTTDFAAADILDIEASLGRVASETTVVCGGADSVEIRLNAVHTLYPEVDDNQFSGDRGGERRFDYDSPIDVVDASQATLTIGNNESFTYNNTCRNIQIIAVTGTPEITVS